MYTLETVETLSTEEAKLRRIRHAITLQSCKYNRNERHYRIHYLKSIDDDQVLDYVLSTYCEPYSEYMSGRTPKFKKAAIDLHEFLRRTGGLNSSNSILDFCLNRFYIPESDSQKERDYIKSLEEYIKNDNGRNSNKDFKEEDV